MRQSRSRWEARGVLHPQILCGSPTLLRTWLATNVQSSVRCRNPHFISGPPPGGTAGQILPEIKKNIFKMQKTFWLLGKTSLCNHIPPPNISAGCDPAPFQRRIVGVY